MGRKRGDQGEKVGIGEVESAASDVGEVIGGARDVAGSNNVPVCSLVQRGVA
jgi:hypothetical protein